MTVSTRGGKLELDTPSENLNTLAVLCFALQRSFLRKTNEVHCLQQTPFNSLNKVISYKAITLYTSKYFASEMNAINKDGYHTDRYLLDDTFVFEQMTGQK